MSDLPKIVIKQDACRHASNKMLEYLMQFDAMQNIKLGDVKWIANQVSSLVFDAIEYVEENKGFEL